MARAPMAAPGGAAPDADADPMADAGMGDDGGDSGETVLVTITKGSDGGYIVYSGDEDEGGDDASAAGGTPDAAAMPPAPAGQPADTIGAALKAALDILQEDQNSSGAPGSSQDQFASGFGSDSSPTPAPIRAKPKMKYPAAAAV